MGIVSAENSDQSVEMATAKPRERQFQVVPVPGTFTRGRWKCWDYREIPNADGEILNFTEKAEKVAPPATMPVLAETSSQNLNPPSPGDKLTHTISEPQFPAPSGLPTPTAPVDVPLPKESSTILVTSIAPAPMTPSRGTPSSIDALDSPVALSNVHCVEPPSTLTILSESDLPGNVGTSLLSPPLTLSSTTTTASSATSIPPGSVSPQPMGIPSPAVPLSTYIPPPAPLPFSITSQSILSQAVPQGILSQGIPQNVSAPSVAQPIMQQSVAQGIMQQSVPQGIMQQSVVQGVLPQSVPQNGVPHSIPHNVVMQQSVPPGVMQQSVPQAMPQTISQGIITQSVSQGIPQTVAQGNIPQSVSQGGIMQPIPQAAVQQSLQQGVIPQSLPQGVIPQQLQQGIISQQLQQGVVPQQLSQGIIPQSLPQGVIPQQLQQGVIPQQLQQGVVPQQLPQGVIPQSIPQGMVSQGVVTQQTTIPQQVIPQQVLAQPVAPQPVYSQPVSQPVVQHSVAASQSGVVPQSSAPAVAPPHVPPGIASAVLSRQTSSASFADSIPPSLVARAAEGSVDESASTANATSGPNVAIDNKIEQAMDLVKTHLTFAVREEVEILRSTIVDLETKVSQLESQNQVLKQFAPAEVVANLALLVQNAQQQKVLQQQLQQMPNVTASVSAPATAQPMPSNPQTMVLNAQQAAAAHPLLVQQQQQPVASAQQQPVATQTTAMMGNVPVSNLIAHSPSPDVLGLSGTSTVVLATDMHPQASVPAPCINNVAATAGAPGCAHTMAL